MTHIEEQIAHLTKMVDELSQETARQQGEISMLTRRVQLLMEREAEREAQADGGVVLGNERPPHW